MPETGQQSARDILKIDVKALKTNIQRQCNPSRRGTRPVNENNKNKYRDYENRN